MSNNLTFDDDVDEQMKEPSFHCIMFFGMEKQRKRGSERILQSFHMKNSISSHALPIFDVPGRKHGKDFMLQEWLEKSYNHL